MGGLIAIVATVSHLAAAGPAIAGDAVVWGEQARSGALKVVSRSGTATRVVQRIPPPRGRHGQRSFSGVPGGLSASEHWIAYGRDDGKCRADGDVVSCELDMNAYGAHDGGPFRRLLPGCDSAAYISTSSDGDGVAIGQASGRCGDRVATRVWLKEGDAEPRLVFDGGRKTTLRQVELAGPWIAWSTGGSGSGDTHLTVAERATGTVVARYRTRDFVGDGTGLGGDTFMAFALDADGNVAALTGPQPSCYLRCLAIRNVTGGPARTLTKRASDRSVALAGGRVAWISSPKQAEKHVVVADLDGADRRRFDTFTRKHGPIGELALVDGRVAWATVQDPYSRESPGAVHSASLSR